MHFCFAHQATNHLFCTNLENNCGDPGLNFTSTGDLMGNSVPPTSSLMTSKPAMMGPGSNPFMANSNIPGVSTMMNFNPAFSIAAQQSVAMSKPLATPTSVYHPASNQIQLNSTNQFGMIQPPKGVANHGAHVQGNLAPGNSSQNAGLNQANAQFNPSQGNVGVMSSMGPGMSKASMPTQPYNVAMNAGGVSQPSSYYQPVNKSTGPPSSSHAPVISSGTKSISSHSGSVPSSKPQTPQGWSSNNPFMYPEAQAMAGAYYYQGQGISNVS